MNISSYGTLPKQKNILLYSINLHDYVVSFENLDSNSVVCVLDYNGHLWESILTPDILTSNAINLNRLVNIIKLNSINSLPNYSIELQYNQKNKKSPNLLMVLRYSADYVDWTELIIFVQKSTSLIQSTQFVGEGMLERFEREELEKEKQIKKNITREIAKKEKRVQEELEKKRLQEQEDNQLERIIRMFNSKDLPNLNAGSCQPSGYYGGQYWNLYGIFKFKFNLNVIKNITNHNLNDLHFQYKKLCGDLMWIKKYVYGNENSKPFVDYVFDYKEKNCIQYEIDGFQTSFDQNKLSHSRCYQCGNGCGYLNMNRILTVQLGELEKLKIIFERMENSREYYYVNYEEFLDLFGTKNHYGFREFERGGNAQAHPINLDNIDGRSYNGGGGYFGNSSYYHIWHIFDREKLNKLNFLNDICKNIGIIHSLGNYLGSCGEPLYCENHNPSVRYNGSGDLILDHINYIIKSMNYDTNSPPIRQRLVSSSDFDDLIKIANVLVELIEFVKPEILLIN